MTHSQQATAAKKELLLRRASISRLRTDQNADVIELGAEKRSEEHAQNDEISDVLMLLSERETVKLQEVDAALKRLELGTWGTCEKCGAAIDTGRMAALPEARTCTSCAV